MDYVFWNNSLQKAIEGYLIAANCTETIDIVLR